MLTAAKTTAEQCRELGIDIGDCIIGRESSGSYWSEAELTLLWLGETTAVFRVRERSRGIPAWQDRGESASWTLQCRDWIKVQNLCSSDFGDPLTTKPLEAQR